MRAPPESLRPMIGAPLRTARSMTLQILAACPSARDPPKTVKSWEKTYTLRPSMRPKPVTTPSPVTRSSSAMSSVGRAMTTASSSVKLPSSRRSSIRSCAAAVAVRPALAPKAPARATTIAPALPAPAEAITAGIVTTGDAIVRVKTDAAVVGVGAIVQGSTAAQAQDLLAQRIDALLQKAKALGIADADTKTAIYRIDPQYAYEQGKAPRLTGFQGTQQLVLTLHGTDGVGRALDT